VEVGHPADDVLEEAAGLLLFEFGLLDDVVEELAALDVLHDEEEVAGGLDDLPRTTLTSYSWMMLGWRMSLRMCISRETRSTSATSMIFSFTRILMATF
jgi:hypothetical protein